MGIEGEKGARKRVKMGKNMRQGVLRYIEKRNIKNSTRKV